MGQSSASNDVVDVWMLHEVLSPGVQDADEPDLCSQVFRVFREFRKSLRNGFEQDPIEDFLIPEDKRIQLIRNGENNVKVRYGKQVFFPVLDPLFLLQELAFGTVPVSAGVVRDHLCPTVLTLIHVATQISCAASFYCAHSAKTIRGHGMGAAVIRAVPA